MFRQSDTQESEIVTEKYSESVAPSGGTVVSLNVSRMFMNAFNEKSLPTSFFVIFTCKKLIDSYTILALFIIFVIKLEIRPGDINNIILIKV